MRISDWSSDVCSSDLAKACQGGKPRTALRQAQGETRCPTPPTPFALSLSKGCPSFWPTLKSCPSRRGRSEEHTSELQSLMRISYAVFCLKKKKKTEINNKQEIQQESIITTQQCDTRK